MSSDDKSPEGQFLPIGKDDQGRLHGLHRGPEGDAPCILAPSSMESP